MADEKPQQQTEPKPGQQRLTLTPEKAIAYVDGALAKFQGTRDDHKVLEASMNILRGVVQEWSELKGKPNGAGTNQRASRKTKQPKNRRPRP